MDENRIIHATNEFIKYLQNLELNLDIDNFAYNSKTIFLKQEEDYKSNSYYSLFSMLSLAFLQLGIIEL